MITSNVIDMHTGYANRQVTAGRQLCRRFVVIINDRSIHFLKYVFVPSVVCCCMSICVVSNNDAVKRMYLHIIRANITL